MKPRSLSLLLILTAGLMSCSTPDAQPDLQSVKPGVDGPEVYDFPKAFFVEQNLVFKSPEGVKKMIGQLQRDGATATLVLTEGTSSLVLARLALKQGAQPELVFLAPALKDKGFPAQEIGEAVQALIETPRIFRGPEGFHVADKKSRRWVYHWQDFVAGKNCLFPRILELSFLDPRYHLTITVRDLECGAKAKA